MSEVLNKKATPCLVDLGAWANLATPDLGFQRYFTGTERLNSDDIFVLRTSSFFQQLIKIQEGPVFSLLTDIVQRECLWMASVDHIENGVSVEQALGCCPVLNNFYNQDSAKIYSLLQYLELLFLIEMIIIKNNSRQTIKFILPNDEDKYYPDLEQLEEDIRLFLLYRLDFCKALDIQLLCFKYGKKTSQRPYLNPTQGFVENTLMLNKEDIIETSLLVTNPTNQRSFL